MVVKHWLGTRPINDDGKEENSWKLLWNYKTLQPLSFSSLLSKLRHFFNIIISIIIIPISHKVLQKVDHSLSSFHQDKKLFVFALILIIDLGFGWIQWDNSNPRTSCFISKSFMATLKGSKHFPEKVQALRYCWNYCLFVWSLRWLWKMMENLLCCVLSPVDCRVFSPLVFGLLLGNHCGWLSLFRWG